MNLLTVYFISGVFFLLALLNCFLLFLVLLVTANRSNLSHFIICFTQNSNQADYELYQRPNIK